MVGVQYHPELEDENASLFEELIKETKKTSRRWHMRSHYRLIWQKVELIYNIILIKERKS